MKDRILALVTHELRAPLTPILMLSELLAGQTEFDGDTRDALETIHGNALLATRLISDLLDLSKVHFGKLQMHVQPVDVHAIIRQAEQTVRFDAEERQIELTAELTASSHVVQGDVDRLTQTVLNLLTNAVKFTSRGGSVSVRTWDEPDDHIALAVTDTGIGIDPARLPWLFDPFYQAPEEQSAPRHGLGLGLAISRMLVEAHGGSLTASSRGVGHGAEFVVRLPTSPTAVF